MRGVTVSPIKPAGDGAKLLADGLTVYMAPSGMVKINGNPFKSRGQAIDVLNTVFDKLEDALHV